MPDQSNADRMRIFISFSSGDSEVANELGEELKKQRVSPWIYTQCLNPGSIWLKEIDEALGDADYVLGIITERYLSSKGAVEAYVTIADGLQKMSIKFIPLFFISPSKVRSLLFKGIQGFNFSESFKDGIFDLVKFLKKEEGETAKVMLAKVDSPESTNPFGLGRTEYFHNNYELLARAFARPENEKYDIILENKPVIIFGGRGCGKSMILKSLTPNVQLHRTRAKNFEELKQKGIKYFGIYSKVEKGSLLIYDYDCVVEMGFAQMGFPKDHTTYKRCLQILNMKHLPINYIENEPILSAGLNTAWAITLNELNLKILSTLLEELISLSKPSHNSSIALTIGKAAEQRIVQDVFAELGIISNDTSFDGLIKLINAQLAKIGAYVQDICTPFAKPTVGWVRTDIHFLDRVLKIVSENIEDFTEISFFLLVDEFENLRPFQQTIIIEWIKTARNFVVKVACKFEGMYTNKTLQGQPLQFGQDCPRIELDYDLLDESGKRAYRDLLIKICRNLLDIAKYKERDITKILEEPREPEFPQDVIDKEIRLIRENGKLKFDRAEIEEYRNKLQIAAIFRLLKKNQRIYGKKVNRKMYAGLETYMYLSSGIIRIFLNLTAMALYKAQGAGANLKNGEKIAIKHQTWAAYVVSRAWLEKVPDNYDLGGQGERIYQFIVDIGDILRERLLNKPTAPECLSITLIDSASLDKPKYSLLREILEYSERESLLYKRKESSARDKGREFMLNRIHAPILGLTHRARWVSHAFAANELNDLLSESLRERTKRKLIRRARNRQEGESSPLTGFLEDN
jgi:hypothetical protein